MSFAELFLIALGLSMDAFAISVCIGLSIPVASLKNMLLAGAYFGLFQCVMPIIGFILTNSFADSIMAAGHWIAFALLSVIGCKMIMESFEKQRPSQTPEDNASNPDDTLSLGFTKMLPLAVATSIDALAVGVSFSLLKVNIAPASLCIGVTTFILSMAGVKIGKLFGRRFKTKAEFVGGLILVLMGIKILLESYGYI